MNVAPKRKGYRAQPEALLNLDSAENRLVVKVDGNNHALAILLEDTVVVVLRKGCSSAQVNTPVKNIMKRAELILANTVCCCIPLLWCTNIAEGGLNRETC